MTFASLLLPDENHLVLYDFSTPSIEAFKMTVDIASKCNGSFIVLHVISPPRIDPIAGRGAFVYSQDFFLCSGRSRQDKDKIMTNVSLAPNVHHTLPSNSDLSLA